MLLYPVIIMANPEAYAKFLARINQNSPCYIRALHRFQ